MVRVDRSRAKRSGEDRRGDLSAPRLPQRGGARSEGRAGGEHVVDEQRRDRWLADDPHSRRVEEARRAVATDLAATATAREAESERRLEALRRGSGDQLAGVEAAAVKAKWRRRDRDDHPSAELEPGVRRGGDRAAGDPRELQPAAELERGD
jgi:hypothetical protein